MHRRAGVEKRLDAARTSAYATLNTRLQRLPERIHPADIPKIAALAVVGISGTRGDPPRQNRLMRLQRRASGALYQLA